MLKYLRSVWEASKRRRNFLTDRRLQLTFALHFTLAFLLVFITLAIVYLIFLIRFFHFPVHVVDLSYLQQIISDQWLAFVFFMLSLFCLPFAVALAAILLTHKVIGPFIPIHRHLSALVVGDYGQGPVRIRRSDYIHRFVNKLNLAIDAFKQRDQETLKLLESLRSRLEEYPSPAGHADLDAHIKKMKSRFVKRGPIESYDDLVENESK